jgi:hypothetical protein
MKERIRSGRPTVKEKHFCYALLDGLASSTGGLRYDLLFIGYTGTHSTGPCTCTR